MTRARAGFTLVELLVSASLLALLSAGITLVMSTSLGAWRAQQQRDSFSQQAQAIIDIISQDVQSAFIGRAGFFVSYEEEPGIYALECTTLGRRTQRLAYLEENAEQPDENVSDHAQVVYFVEPTEDQDRFALYRQEICPPLPEPLTEEERDSGQALLLSDEVSRLQVRFCDGQDWLEEWDTTTQEGTQSLPAAVEISLALWDGEREQTYTARVPVMLSEQTQATTQ